MNERARVDAVDDVVVRLCRLARRLIEAGGTVPEVARAVRAAAEYEAAYYAAATGLDPEGVARAFMGLAGDALGGSRLRLGG